MQSWWAVRDSNLSRFAGVRARRRNPERSEGPQNLALRSNAVRANSERLLDAIVVGGQGLEPRTSCL